jgi:D-alanine-D-alanine ligase
MKEALGYIPSASLRIAVVYNTDFDEPSGNSLSYEADAEIREIAARVAAILETNGHEPTLITVSDRLGPLADQLRAGGTDAAFNLVESLGGEPSREAEVPELLESLRIPYTGNHASVLRLAHAKDETRRVLEGARVAVPRGFVIQGEDPEAIDLPFPLFIKPARTDASIGIDQGSILRDQRALRERLVYLRASFPGPYLVEEYLPGKEVNVAIFPEPIAGRLVCTEIDFSACAEGVAPIVTYDCKWRPGTPDYSARSVPCEGRSSPAMIEEAQRVARQAFLAIGGGSYGRVDLRLGEDDRFYVIDVNPNPDLDPEAGLSIAARSVGVEHDALIMSLLDQALSVRS